MSEVRWLRHVAWVVLLAVAPGVLAQEAAHVLFPSDAYAPVVDERNPPGTEVPPLKQTEVQGAVALTGVAAGTSADRCFAQCQSSFQVCRAQPHGVNDCAIKRGGCASLQDPAKRNTCFAQVQDCQARGAIDACEANHRQCLGACGN